MREQKMMNQKEKRTTITQVAQKAGVTIATVSHVINGTAPISEETKKRVREAIEELQYVPNATAKALRSRRKTSIGLMIPNLNNNFHSKVTSVFVEEAYKEGYSVQIHGYEYSLEREKRELERLERNDIGTVVIFNGAGDEERIRRFLKKEIPVILVDRSTTLPDVPYIRFDNHKIMSEIVSMLKEKGYNRIGFFSEPVVLTNLQDRLEGYKEALARYGYAYRPEDIYIKEDLCLDNLRNGYRFMKEILQSKKKEELPDAWIASSDLLAIGLMRAMDECGYRVPADFGVVGFDNIEVSGFVNPRLTTVEQDQVLLGKKLMELVKKVNQKEKNVEIITLEQKLIVRNSCK